MERKNQKTRSVGNGEGSLYYSEALNRWIFQYYDTQSKRQTMKQRKKETVKDFKARVTKVKNELNTGTYIEKRKDTIQMILKNHIEQKLTDGITLGNSYTRDLDTLKQIEKCCSSFIDKPIQKVSLKDIQFAKEAMKQYSQSCINKMWQLLKKAFAIASSPSVGLIHINIMNDENLLKPCSNNPTKKVVPLLESERKKLNSILDNEEKNHKYRDIVKLEWITAMRIGEVLARSKDDILENQTLLRINNTLTKDKDGNIILGTHTKTYDKKRKIDRGKRNFPLDKELKDILNRQLNKKIVNIYGLLFWDYEENTFITEHEINSWLKRLNEKYNISTKDLHNHRLRHDRITIWKESGMDITAIQYLAGHVEDSDVTDEYIDISQEYAFAELKKAK